MKVQLCFRCDTPDGLLKVKALSPLLSRWVMALDKL